MQSKISLSFVTGLGQVLQGRNAVSWQRDAWGFAYPSLGSGSDGSHRAVWELLHPHFADGDVKARAG